MTEINSDLANINIDGLNEAEYSVAFKRLSQLNRDKMNVSNLLDNKNREKEIVTYKINSLQDEIDEVKGKLKIEEVLLREVKNERLKLFEDSIDSIMAMSGHKREESIINYAKMCD